MNTFLKQHKWPFLVILLFILGCFIIINSNYHFAHGDAAAFAMYAKSFHETNRLNTKGAATALIGQLLFTRLFTLLFGYSLKTLHIAVYAANFLALIGMYLLLFELGLSPFLSLIGALGLYINPISIKLIDWYMSEPFFMCYFLFALFFFVKGLKRGYNTDLYLGGILGIFAILTRQHGISLAIAVILLCTLYRKKLKNNTLYHAIISASLPIVAISSYYLLLFLGKRLSGAVPYGYAPENIAMIKDLLNPAHLFSRLYFDSLTFLHYSVLYVAPLFIIISLSLCINPERLKAFFSHLYILIISFISLCIGTVYLYRIKGRLMPFKPSIFSIGNLTQVFRFHIIGQNKASCLLTIFTGCGAVVVLYMILIHLFFRDGMQNTPPQPNEKVSEKGKKRKRGQTATRTNPHKVQDKPFDPGSTLMYIWGIIYILTTIIVGFRYDRYVFPLSIFTIYLILINFSFIERQKALIVLIFTLFFTVFIFNIAVFRLALEVQWEAGDVLIKEGIPPIRINAGLGFNNYYSFDNINDLYKGIRIQRPVNWQLFHPMADYFINHKKDLEKDYPGLELYKSLSKRRWFGIFDDTFYIYKRKQGYTKFIWLG